MTAATFARTKTLTAVTVKTYRGAPSLSGGEAVRARTTTRFSPRGYRTVVRRRRDAVPVH